MLNYLKALSIIGLTGNEAYHILEIVEERTPFYDLLHKA